MSENNIDARARENAKKAQQLPASVQYAIVKVLPNILNGAFWGFTDLRDIKAHYDALMQDKNITPRKLGANACLLEVNPAYIIKAIQMVDNQTITDADLNTMQKAMAEAQIDFEKFLIRMGKRGTFSGTVGIYCTNDTTSIAYKGKSYPAFRLSMGDVLTRLSAYGYKIKVGNAFVTPQQATQSGQVLWDSVELSPTKTGLFINIESTLSADQYKQLEAQFKQKYNIKG